MTLDLGEATVKITWKKAGPGTAQVLRRALKEIQERERQGEVNAA